MRLSYEVDGLGRSAGDQQLALGEAVMVGQGLAEAMCSRLGVAADAVDMLR